LIKGRHKRGGHGYTKKGTGRHMTRVQHRISEGGEYGSRAVPGNEEGVSREDIGKKRENVQRGEQRKGEKRFRQGIDTGFGQKHCGTWKRKDTITEGEIEAEGFLC